MRRTLTMPALLSLLLIGVAGCGDRGLDSDTLARAGDLRFGVDEAAEIIAPVGSLPPDSAVVEALTDFWVDYTLLALAVNQDGVLEELDLSPITRQQRNQRLVELLRDDAIEVDTVVTDEDVEAFYEEERPGERVRARHILLSVPDDATPAQQDSLRSLAEDLRDRVQQGEDFAALAEEYSDDPGSAAQGGDLNYFARGTMVGPFEEAAFDLQPGEVSDVVETQFGFHVIRVDDREFPDLDEVRDDLRGQLRQQRSAEAESTFVAQVEEPAEVELVDDAVEQARTLAEDFSGQIDANADQQTLVQLADGAYTARDYQLFLASQPGQLRTQIAQATDDQIEGLLRELVRGELLVQEAERRGLTLPEGEMEELEEEIRGEYLRFAELLGLDSIEPEEGETLEQAVEREITELMPRLVQGEQNVYPLAALALPLRVHYGVQIGRENVGRAVERVQELREQEPADQSPAELDPGEVEEMLEETGEPGANPDPSDGGGGDSS